MYDLSGITDVVAENTEVVDSASSLIARLADEIDAARGDQAQLDAIVESMRANNGELAQAVAENTPASDTTTPPDGGGTASPDNPDAGLPGTETDNPNTGLGTETQ